MPTPAPEKGHTVEDDEDDYMSMVIEEPQGKETFAQRKLRKQREAEARARVPSKAERAAAEAARREDALASSVLDPSNKGFKMMAKLGFKPGDTLGKASSDFDQPQPESQPESQPLATVTAAANVWAQSRAEPLRLVVKEDRGGIGLDSERKRKFREESEQVTKKTKAEEGDYRERMRLEREERRTEAQVHAAQKVAEKLDAEAGENVRTVTEEDENQQDSDGADQQQPGFDDASTTSKSTKPRRIIPTSQINVLYRGLVRERQERDRDILARLALQESLPSSFFPNTRLPGYDDPTLDRDDKHATGAISHDTSFVEQEIDEEDPELDEFNTLEPKEKLHRLVMHMREQHRYCFWCKFRYDSDDLEGCPGVTEEDHD